MVVGRIAGIVARVGRGRSEQHARRFSPVSQRYGQGSLSFDVLDEHARAFSGEGRYELRVSPAHRHGQGSVTFDIGGVHGSPLGDEALDEGRRISERHGDMEGGVAAFVLDGGVCSGGQEHVHGRLVLRRREREVERGIPRAVSRVGIRAFVQERLGRFEPAEPDRVVQRRRAGCVPRVDGHAPLEEERQVAFMVEPDSLVEHRGAVHEARPGIVCVPDGPDKVREVIQAARRVSRHQKLGYCRARDAGGVHESGIERGPAGTVADRQIRFERQHCLYGFDGQPVNRDVEGCLAVGAFGGDRALVHKRSRETLRDGGVERAYPSLVGEKDRCAFPHEFLRGGGVARVNRIPERRLAVRIERIGGRAHCQKDTDHLARFPENRRMERVEARAVRTACLLATLEEGLEPHGVAALDEHGDARLFRDWDRLHDGGDETHEPRMMEKAAIITVLFIFTVRSFRKNTGFPVPRWRCSGLTGG